MATRSRNNNPTSSWPALASFDKLDVVAWSSGLMLASLMEQRTVESLHRDLHNAGITEKNGSPTTPLSINQAVNQLIDNNLVSASGGHLYIEEKHGNLLIGHAAIQLRKSSSRARSASAKKASADRRERFEAIGEHILSESGFHPFGFHGQDSETHQQREIRALYWLGRNRELSLRLMNEHDAFAGIDSTFLFEPFDATQLATIENPAISHLVGDALGSFLIGLDSPDELLEFFNGKPWPESLWLAFGELHFLQGNFSEVLRVINALEENAKAEAASPVADDVPGLLATSAQLRACLEFAAGKDSEAIALFEQAMAHRKGKSRRKKMCPLGLGGILLVLALCRRNDPTDADAALQYARWGDELNNCPFPSWLEISAQIASSLSGSDRETDRYHHREREMHLYEIEANFGTLLFTLFSRLHEGEHFDKRAWSERLAELQENADGGGYRWIKAEARALLQDFEGKSAVQSVKIDGSVVVPFSTAIKGISDWEKCLLGIEKIARECEAKSSAKGIAKVGSSAARKELFWILDTWHIDDQPLAAAWNLYPFERTLHSSKRGSKGRKIAVQRLKEKADTLPFATAQDLEIARTAQRVQSWGGGSAFDISSPKALLALAGHPMVYTDKDRYTPIEVTKSSPRLDVSKASGGGSELRFVPDIPKGKPAAFLVRENSQRFTVYEVTTIQKKLGELLQGDQAVALPPEAHGRLLNAVSTLAGEINIGADRSIGDTLTEIAEPVPGDPVPRLRLTPSGAGLDLRILIRPAAGSDLETPPGDGKAVLFSSIDSKSCKIERDLEAEKRSATEVVDRCPTLRRHRGEISPDLWHWQFESPVDCLELLDEIQHLGPEQLIVEWPEGQPFRLVGSADTEQLEVKAGGSIRRGKTDWLKASAELKVSDDLVISMRELLDLLGKAEGSSASHLDRGFIHLGKNEFLALSKNLRQQLADLYSASRLAGTAHRDDTDDSILIHPLAALAFDELTRTAAGPHGKIRQSAWKEQLTRLEAARDHSPDAPADLRADLRPYQLEGYRWLSRLAILGAGACLADDMGLGKTVQALALLLERSAKGPSLVIAPTSVAANWINETRRFAPTLRPLLFGDGDRNAMLENLLPGDLVIASYGLLHSEIELLSKVEWNTVILDEAQAIKNSATQRSKAAMKLRAGFRIITTGTPIENRLAELHNLFHFINPGLLGSREQFRQIFVEAIEGDGDGQPATQRLRRMIRPFLLRRMKSDVLRDLPPRTDIELTVEPSEAETAFYEALRIKAIEEIESASPDDGPGAIRILAELTRLRRACCHPRLIDPDTTIESSKLNVFTETLEEILSGGHKVLVFSQFVDHLKIVREHLDEQAIRYQYLDGSTPAKKRQKAVDAFQSGDGDVFLISLKAGGFGLNLTAADYVIHLDPWWNPATEDQASDRAHRIGQQRPVTVYRLVMKNTIEEKIVELHHRKRDLAGSLLAGSDSAARLSPDDMLALLRGEK